MSAASSAARTFTGWWRSHGRSIAGIACLLVAGGIALAPGVFNRTQCSVTTETVRAAPISEPSSVKITRSCKRQDVPANVPLVFLVAGYLLLAPVVIRGMPPGSEVAAPGGV